LTQSSGFVRLNIGMRWVFADDDQVSFFKEIKEKSGLSNEVLGSFIGVSGRSFGDWVNRKTLPSKEGVLRLGQKFKIMVPKILEEREEFWSGRIHGRKAALKRLKIYGPPGTPEGRRKGGLVSWQRRRENPDVYRKLGCIVGNKFIKPKKSEDLAEFVGIVLGDGCLTKDQCQISLNMIDDKEYVKYVARLVSKLFGYDPTVAEYPGQTVTRIIITGVYFIKIMKSFGLIVGNKTKNQVGVPEWIKSDKNFFRACIRGLFDTDGGTFTHKHKVKRYDYCHFGLTYTSACKPLLSSFKKCLEVDDIKTYGKKDCLFVYRVGDINSFFNIYQTKNLKHVYRFKDHLSRSTRLN